jgi:hypothetical protein
VYATVVCMQQWCVCNSGVYATVVCMQQWCVCNMLCVHTHGMAQQNRLQQLYLPWDLWSILTASALHFQCICSCCWKPPRILESSGSLAPSNLIFFACVTTALAGDYTHHGTALSTHVRWNLPVLLVCFLCLRGSLGWHCIDHDILPQSVGLSCTSTGCQPRLFACYFHLL